MLHSLYATLPIFAGGVLNTIAVSVLIAMRMQTTPAYLWALLEIVIAALRLPLLVLGRREAPHGRQLLTDLYILLAVAWAASVGYGTFICVVSGDWIAATLACLSSAAMVGGICFRNFGAPRLVAVMIALSLGPCAIAAALSGHQILLLVMFQIPFYLISMSVAAFQLKQLLVRTMRAEMQNDHHARHDPLTGLLNRGGLARWSEERGNRKAVPTAVFYLDLDWFKNINDTFGHKAGDDVLARVADRLRALIGDSAEIARLGGDEFVVIAENISRDEADHLGQKINAAIADEGYETAGQISFVGASVGTAHSFDHGNAFAELLDAADTAQNAAKSRNHGNAQRRGAPKGATPSHSRQRTRTCRATIGPARMGSFAAMRRVRRRLSSHTGHHG